MRLSSIRTLQITAPHNLPQKPYPSPFYPHSYITSVTCRSRSVPYPPKWRLCVLVNTRLQVTMDVTCGGRVPLCEGIPPFCYQGSGLGWVGPNYN